MSPEYITSVNQFSDEEILKLYSRFRSIDKSHDGYIQVSEILGINPELSDNPLTHRVVSVFDKNGAGKISFMEFVTGLARASTDDESKKRFMFDVYDMDGDGLISNGDLFNAVSLMCGNNLSRHQLQQLVDRTMRDADQDGDGRLSFEEFERALGKVELGLQLGL